LILAQNPLGAKHSDWSSIESFVKMLSQQMHMASMENSGYSSRMLKPLSHAYVESVITTFVEDY